MSRIERFQSAAQLEGFIEQAKRNGQRICLGHDHHTVEIFDKNERNFLDKFRSAQSLAHIFKNESLALQNKLLELRATEAGGLPDRGVKKLSTSNEPVHAGQIDPDIEVHRAIVGVLPTIGRISVDLKIPFLPNKLDQLGRLLNDERIPLNERINHALSVLAGQTGRLRSASGDENTPGHFQIENFANYIELQSLQRKQASLQSIPKAQSQTAAFLNHRNDPFALKRFAYKALPVISNELSKKPDNAALVSALNAGVTKLIQHHTTSIEFDQNRTQLLALEPQVIKALKNSPLKDSAKAVFETIKGASPDRLETLLASDLAVVAKSLAHQKQTGLANAYEALAKKLQGSSNIAHEDLHQVVTELRFLTDQTLELVDGFDKQPGDADLWPSIRDKQNVKQFAYAFQSSVEPWKVSPQEFEYVRNRVSQYEVYEAPEKDLEQALVKTFEISEQDIPWYEQDPETLFAPAAHNVIQQPIPEEEVFPNPVEEQALEPSATPTLQEVEGAPVGEINPTPELLVKAYAASIQHKIDQAQFVAKVALRDELLAQGRVQPQSLATLSRKEVAWDLQPVQELVTAQAPKQSVLEVVSIDTAKNYAALLKADSRLYQEQATEFLSRIDESLQASHDRQNSNPSTAAEEADYRVQLRSYAADISAIAYEGENRKAVNQVIAKFNSQVGANFDEVLTKHAPTLSPKDLIAFLKTFARESRSSISATEKRLGVGYANPADEEQDKAHLQSLLRREDLYLKALSKAEQTWPDLGAIDDAVAAKSVLDEALLLQQIISGEVPANIDNIQEQIQTAVGNLSELVIAQIGYRENPAIASAYRLSDADLKKALDSLTQLQYASNLNEAELQAELLALQKARDGKVPPLSEAQINDLTGLLAIRSNEIEGELNANLAIASLKDVTFDEGGDLTGYGNEGIEFSPTQKLWAQYAVDASVNFLASRLSLLKNADKLFSL